MKLFQCTLILSWLVYSFSVSADSSPLRTQTQGDVVFVSGGIGGDERDALQAVRSDYNLSLQFSMQGSGEYLSDVAVRISGANNRTVLETLADGPILFAQLKPGRYRISAEHEGQEIRKSVTIDNKHRSPLLFTWGYN